MKKIITLSQEAYDNKKANLVGRNWIRKSISMAGFKLVDRNHIEIDDTKIEITPAAFEQLLKRLRIPQAFANRFSQQFGDNGMAQLIDMIKSDAHDREVTLLVDGEARQVVDVLPMGRSCISDEAFFGFIEQTIDGHNLGVTHVGTNAQGGSTINCISNSNLSGIPGMPEEIFQCGVQFRNGPRFGLEVMPYLTRLTCSNGMSSQKFNESFKLHQIDARKIDDFNKNMTELAKNGFRPKSLVEKIQQANETGASLGEMDWAISQMMSADKSVTWDGLQRYVPAGRSDRAYSEIGHFSQGWSKRERSRAKSGISMWDLVNGMTNFASNDKRFNIGDGKRSDIMISAGNMLMKSDYNLSARHDVDPFKGGSLLTEAERAGVRGDI